MDINSKKYKSNKRLWLLKGGLGAVLVGTGISCVIEVAFLKHEGAIWWKWVGLGTLSLTILMAGLSIFIDAVRHRIKMDE